MLKSFLKVQCNIFSRAIVYFIINSFLLIFHLLDYGIISFFTNPLLMDEKFFNQEC